jgi:hypothetical protein
VACDQKKDRLSTFLPAKKYIDLHIIKSVQKKHKICIVKEVTNGMPLNIYQNDIHDIFGENCDPVELGNIMFNSKSWADDLVLVSTSKSGLQNCINKE